jgi:LuxR family maltose regulon positive regulatory protein
LTLAEPEGYVRLFVDEGQPMVHLLALALAHGIAPEYVARLLAAFPDGMRPVAGRAILAPLPQPLLEPLSERELEVLRLMAGGLTYREIADHLIISINTVRHHTRNIHGKLGAHRRAEALARARDLGLL